MRLLVIKLRLESLIQINNFQCTLTITSKMILIWKLSSILV